MSTIEETVSVQEISPGRQLNLEDFVRNATWRELLYELVETNQLDPWDIDIQKVVDGYIGLVKKMKVLDLHVPANIILAASILLRLKSESLKVPEEQPIPEPEEMAAQRVIPQVEQLVPRLRMQPGKKISLVELMQALDEVMKLKDKREMMLQNTLEPVKFVINKEDIDQKIERIYSLVEEHADSEGLTTFADLANKFTQMESILLDLFIPLLFLAHKDRIDVAQEKFFDEIFIKLKTVS